MANIITAGNSSNGGTAISTDTSGTLNIVTGSGSGANAITIDASQVVTIPGNLTVSGTLSASGGVSGGIRSGTAVASTSGTSIDFTSIPTGVKRITVMLSGVSTNGTSIVQIQIGSSSFSTSGYTSGSQVAVQTSASTGFILTNSGSTGASNILTGAMTLSLLNSNTWVANGVMYINSSNNSLNSGISPALAGALDRVRITTVNGTDAFDAGTINILFE